MKIFENDIDINFENLSSIPKKYYRWRPEYGDPENRQIGTSAQKIEKIYPELICETDGKKSVAYDRLSVIALAAIDKLNRRVSELESKLK